MANRICDVHPDDSSRILDISKNPFLDIDTAGAFDDNGVMSSCVLAIDDTLYLHYTGFLLSHEVRYYVFSLAIGEDSFGIFLVHWFFVWEFAAALFALGLGGNLLFYPVLFLLTLTSSYLSVEAIYRLPFSNIIIGNRREKESNPP